MDFRITTGPTSLQTSGAMTTPSSYDWPTTTRTPIWSTRAPFYGYDMPMDITTYGVPLAFTVLVVLILCMVIVYTKARRRRERLLRGPENNLRSISGGVPMHVAAYRNYGMHLGQADAGVGSMVSGYPVDLPPSYEVAIQSPPPGIPSQAYPSNISLLPAPPAYTAAIETRPNLSCLPQAGQNPPIHPHNPQRLSDNPPRLSHIPQDSGDTSTLREPSDTTSRLDLPLGGGDTHKKETEPPEVDCNPRIPKPQAGTSGLEHIRQHQEQEVQLHGQTEATEETPSGEELQQHTREAVPIAV